MSWATRSLRGGVPGIEALQQRHPLGAVQFFHDVGQICRVDIRQFFLQDIQFDVCLQRP